MQAKDLMVGNLVRDRGYKLLRIDWIEKDKVCMDFYNDSPFPMHPLTEYFEFLKPIPLTEEILVKCGYQIVKENSAGVLFGFDVNGTLHNDLNILLWKTTVNKGKFFRFGIEIEYLHELQNLFKALTKQELEVKI